MISSTIRKTNNGMSWDVCTEHSIYLRCYRCDGGRLPSLLPIIDIKVKKSHAKPLDFPIALAFSVPGLYLCLTQSNNPAGDDQKCHRTSLLRLKE